MSPCIILLKAWLLPVTVGEHVACGRHNLTALFPVPAEPELFVCVFAFRPVCMCCSLSHGIVFIAYRIVCWPFSGQETIWFTISVVAAGLHESLCWQYTVYVLACVCAFHLYLLAFMCDCVCAVNQLCKRKTFVDTHSLGLFLFFPSVFSVSLFVCISLYFFLFPPLIGLCWY